MKVLLNESVTIDNVKHPSGAVIEISEATFKHWIENGVRVEVVKETKVKKEKKQDEDNSQ